MTQQGRVRAEQVSTKITSESVGYNKASLVSFSGRWGRVKEFKHILAKSIKLVGVGDPYFT